MFCCCCYTGSRDDGQKQKYALCCVQLFLETIPAHNWKSSLWELREEKPFRGIYSSQVLTQVWVFCNVVLSVEGTVDVKNWKQNNEKEKQTKESNLLAA